MIEDLHLHVRYSTNTGDFTRNTAKAIDGDA